MVKVTGVKFYIKDEVEELNTVIDYFIHNNWKIEALIGHSRGNLIIMLAILARPFIARFMIDVSGRIFLKQGFSEKHADHMHLLDTEGHFVITNRSRSGNEKKVKVYKSTVALWEKMDTELSKLRYFPPQVTFLIIHGTSDETIPLRDPTALASSVPNHHIHLVTGADHNFRGSPTDGGPSYHQQVIDKIVSFLNSEKTTLNSFIRANNTENPLNFHLEKPKVKFTNNFPTSKIIKVAGVQNFRDFGGYPVGDAEGRIIRSRILYRSGMLSYITEEGKNVLRALNVTSYFDLRSNPEVTKYGAPGLENFGVSRVYVPIFSDQDFSPEALGVRWQLYTKGVSGFAQVYMIITETCPASYAQYLRALISILPSNEEENPTKAILLHCTAGKDRTGIYVAILLDFLGVDEDLIARDYSLSEPLLHWTDDEIKAISDRSGGALDIDGVKLMLSARAGSIVMYLKIFKEKYGSSRNYLQSLVGLSERELDLLRSGLLVKPRSLYTLEHTLPPYNSNQSFVLKVERKYFELIRDGRKKSEGRINYGKVIKFHIGDNIAFYPNEGPDSNAVNVEIMRIAKYQTFRDMLTTEGVESLLPGSGLDLDEAVEVYRSFPGYREKESSGCGALCISFKLI
ncbi:hypothetical protein HK098_005100 [Nowakowskiella sp. JEL0407]|nr:hypothetical protein HK098_005100 [Nowakowskiella sp. JEL0407]